MAINEGGSNTPPIMALRAMTPKSTHGTNTERVHSLDSNLYTDHKTYMRNQRSKSAQIWLQPLEQPQNLDKHHQHWTRINAILGPGS